MDMDKMLIILENLEKIKVIINNEEVVVFERDSKERGEQLVL